MHLVHAMSLEDLSSFRQALRPLGLTEYEAGTLSYLMLFGETKAATVASASKIPTARIYETLDHLAKLGLVRTKPGRPVLYSAVDPQQAIDGLISSKRQELEDMTRHASTFVEKARALGRKRKMIPAHSPLLRIIDLGEISENETRRLYEKSKRRILVIAKVGNYLANFLTVLSRATERGVRLKVLLASPQTLDTRNKRDQQRVITQLKESLGRAIDVRFCSKVPLRGTIVDPSSQAGEALFLAEEADVALVFREAAITANVGLVTALASFFGLVWKEAEPIAYGVHSKQAAR
jgi:sugar-specific transcriptional regulator TrmB